MVERPEQKHSIERGIPLRQVACVSFARNKPASCDLRAPLDVKRHRVDEHDVVAAAGEPIRLNARAAANIEHRRRRLRQMPLEQLFRPRELDAPIPALESAELTPKLVVREDLRIERHRRARSSVAAAAMPSIWTMSVWTMSVWTMSV
jgi:hypothetical protein